MKKYQSFLSKKFQFLEVKFSLYLNRRVFIIFLAILVKRNKRNTSVKLL